MMPMNKRRYSKDFREQALSKVYSRPDEQNIDDIATELHMNVGTLKGWMRKATKDQKGPPRQAVKAADFTLAERLLALNQTHGMTEEALNGWCRQRGIFAQDLAQWHKAFCAVEPTSTARQEAATLRELRQTNVQLQREMHRKDKALAEAAALLVLQKKFRALWADEDA